MFKKIGMGLCLMLVSCNDVQDTKTLNVAVPVEMVELDPYRVLDTQSLRVRYQVYDKIIAVDSNGNYVPSLVTEWKYVSPTNLQLTVRSNVQFHNGEYLTAEDIKYTIDRSMTTPTHQSGMVTVKDVEVLSPYKVQVNLKIPYVPALAMFSGSRALVLNKKAAEAGNSYVGTGPFKFKEWNKGQNVLLERFDNHWGEKAKVDFVNIKTVPEALVRMIAVETGEVDIAYDIDYNEKERVSENSKLVFDETPISRIEYVGFNITKYPYSNPKFREAISYAIDVPGIISSAAQGAGVHANSLTSKGIGYTKSEPTEQNIEKAKELLKESGVPEGTKIRLLAIDGVRKRTAEVMQANLKEIGIDLEIMLVEWAKYAQMVYATDTEMFLGGWSGDPDADLYYYIFFHSSNIGAGGNFTEYNNAEMDKLLVMARQEHNPQKRQALYDQIHEKTMKEKALVPLFYPLSTLVHRANISNVRFDSYVLQSWKEVVKN